MTRKHNQHHHYLNPFRMTWATTPLCSLRSPPALFSLWNDTPLPTFFPLFHAFGRIRHIGLDLFFYRPIGTRWVMWSASRRPPLLPGTHTRLGRLVGQGRFWEKSGSARERNRDLSFLSTLGGKAVKNPLLGLGFLYLSSTNLSSCHTFCFLSFHNVTQKKISNLLL